MIPGQTLYLTIEAVRRQFRFVPTKDVVDSIRFIFWYCAKRHSVAVHEATWMSNHAHICLTDVEGLLPKFMCQMNSLISRQLNALTDSNGTNIEKGYSSIEIADPGSMLRLSSYTLANPCAADLVEKVTDWEGVCTYHRDYNEPFVVERPKCGMWSERRPIKQDEASTSDDPSDNPKISKWRRKPSKLPDFVEVQLARPDLRPELSDLELRQLVRKETAIKEANAAAARKAKNKQVLGPEGVLSQDRNARPKTRRPLFQRQPLVAAHDPEVERQRLNRIYRFRQRYKEALDVMVALGKEHAVFPEGTWKMRTLFDVTCEPCTT